MLVSWEDSVSGDVLVINDSRDSMIGIGYHNTNRYRRNVIVQIPLQSCLAIMPRYMSTRIFLWLQASKIVSERKTVKAAKNGAILKKVKLLVDNPNGVKDRKLKCDLVRVQPQL